MPPHGFGLQCFREHKDNIYFLTDGKLQPIAIRRYPETYAGLSPGQLLITQFDRHGTLKISQTKALEGLDYEVNIHFYATSIKFN